eukprot:scaffold8902_cov63-Phaeocystis_antarctica.AAC.3
MAAGGCHPICCLLGVSSRFPVSKVWFSRRLLPARATQEKMRHPPWPRAQGFRLAGPSEPERRTQTGWAPAGAG